MLPPDKTEVDNIYEVRFKNTRKGFYRNIHGLLLYTGDSVVVESDRGYDIGKVSLGGIAAELQMRKKGQVKSHEDIPRIYRKANEKDLELLKKVRDRDAATRIRTREIIEDMKLDMKLSDVEFQGDNTKAIFYYIADHRVDFRELIKVLAREFKVRVEMKQIGLRHEAGLVGGIGSCGRELCCSTWLTSFKTVSTSAARYQNLSLNPMKISGLCGRLKCCLNFELESYMDALKDFPQVQKIETQKGVLFLQKTDIFKGKMWFSYPNETSWYPLGIDEVKSIMEMNREGKKPEASMIKNVNELAAIPEIGFVDVVGQSKLDKQPSGSRRGRGGKKKNRKPGGGHQHRNDRNKKGGGNQQVKKGDKKSNAGKPSQEKKQTGSGGNRRQQNNSKGKPGNRRGGQQGNRNKNRNSNNRRNQQNKSKNKNSPKK